MSGTVDLRKKNSHQVTEMLTSKGFVMIDGDFKYLIKMPMDSVTEENVESIMKEKENTETELDKLKSTTLEKMWSNELDKLLKEYSSYKQKREKIQNTKTSSAKKNVKKMKIIRKK